jgi:quinolinate synthase
MADFIGSTTALLKYTETNAANEFIVATEPGIIHQMAKNSPAKVFIPAPPDNNCACNECPHMKTNTLEKLYICLKYEKPEIIMAEEIRQRAYLPIKRMLEISKAMKN